ncbi:hypothetical protein GCM10010109_18280 [Actinoplanes campanulatus]|nr:hypothetical protein GCM10010109_18280 [Actinoplanes campanulatus]GID36346.1 hypothetical protein Aca09nite_28520 [Actinoplanes campanulatus]
MFLIAVTQAGENPAAERSESGLALLDLPSGEPDLPEPHAQPVELGGMRPELLRVDRGPGGRRHYDAIPER